MEHDEKPLPIDTRLLGALAEKVSFVFAVCVVCFPPLNLVMLFRTICQCRAFAKALHYKEIEFEAVCNKRMGANPVTVVESLIHINNQLHQHEVGSNAICARIKELSVIC
jgi:FKBP12-rapamycin complex-associated protein